MKVFKKAAAGVVAASMIFSAAGMGAMPELGLSVVAYADVNGFSTNGTTITGYTGSEKNITIPSGYTAVADSAFINNTTIESVTIPSGVKTIGSNAFYNCSNLKTVTMADSVTEIGGGAFSNCTALTSLTLSRGISSLPSNFASGCTSLGTITIPSGVTSVGEQAFMNCSSLKTLSLPANLYIIPRYAFQGCSALTSLTLPANATTISDAAFTGCSSLAELTIPSHVTSIGKQAFQSCTSLESVSLSPGVQTIGENAFMNCKKLASFACTSSMTTISKYMLSGCISLKSVTIPNSISTIDANAFYGCISLETVNIPSSVITIGGAAFSGCSSLQSLYIPDSVTSLGQAVFHSCSSLTEVNIPSGITEIGDNTFFGCSKLRSITIPSNITAIRNYAFKDSGLESITIPSGVTAVNSYAFAGCTSLQSVTLPDTITGRNLGTYTFSGCTSLKSVILPENITQISNYTFEGCSGLTTVQIPKAVTTIGLGSFDGCNSLSTINYTGTQSEWDSIRKRCTLPANVTVNYNSYSQQDPVPSLIDISKLTFSAVPDQYYTGAAVKPAVTVKNGNSTLSENTDYTLSYSSNINAGTASVTVTGKGSYTGSKTIQFRIVYEAKAPAGLSAQAGVEEVTLSWQAVPGAAYYAVADMSGPAEQIVKDSITGTSCTVTGLTGGNTYYFAVKAYVGNTWSSVSEAVSATPSYPAIGIPGNVAVTKVGATSVSLSWSSVQRASKYMITDVSGQNERVISDSVTALEHTVQDLEPGTVYSFTVRAYDPYRQEWGAASAVVSAATMPAAPTLTAKAGEEQIVLSWNSVKGAVKYALFDVSGTSEVLLSNTITGTSYTVTGLTAGKPCSYIVKAYNGTKWSEPSNTATATPESAAVFCAPTLTAQAGDGKITLTWNSVPDAVKYAVFDATNPDAAPVLISNKITTESYTVANLTNGKQYSYIVKAYNGKKWSAQSNTVTAAPAGNSFGAPVLTAQAGDGNVTLTWNSVPYAVKYAVFDATNPAAAPVLISNKITTESYTIGNLTNGKQYSYIVKAYNGKKWSAQSNTVTAVPVSSSFGAPVLTAKAGDGKITLTWNSVPDAVKYAVFDATNPAAAPVLISNKITTESYTIGNLTNGKQYSYIVKAYNGKKWSAQSNTAAAVPCSTVPVVSAYPDGNGSIRLTWNGVPGAIKYAVTDVSGQTPVILSNKITKTEYTVSNLTAGKTYSFYVQAYNGKSWSQKSEIAAVSM